MCSRVVCASELSDAAHRVARHPERIGAPTDEAFGNGFLGAEVLWPPTTKGTQRPEQPVPQRQQTGEVPVDRRGSFEWCPRWNTGRHSIGPSTIENRNRPIARPPRFLSICIKLERRLPGEVPAGGVRHADPVSRLVDEQAAGSGHCLLPTAYCLLPRSRPACSAWRIAP